MNTIYAAVIESRMGSPFSPGDVRVAAFDEDGEYITGQISSSPGWAKHDIGAKPTNDGRCDTRYNTRYPDGWVVEWVDNPQSHPVIGPAMRALKEKD